MTSLTDDPPERRSSTFLADAKVDAADQSEWAKMASNSTLTFNDSLPSNEELTNIAALRHELGTLMTTGTLSKQPENISDYKLLRFLRGYENSVEEAAEAYRAMATYRADNNFDTLRQKLIDNDTRDPNLLSEYQPIVQLLAKGLRYEYGFDRKQNLVTVTDIGALDLRAIIKAGLQELYCELCLLTEEYSNLRLHALTVERGRLVARHDLINVSNFGVFQWNKACFDLITTVFAGNKHYPECVVKITSCGNGSVAVIAWKVMKHFVPERTKQKLSVLGTSFVGNLVSEVPFSGIPLSWGGGGVGNGTPYGFDAAWSEECTHTTSLTVGRRDSKKITIGCFKKGSRVQFTWKLQAHSIKVSTSFARLEEEKGGEKGESEGGETKESGGSGVGSGSGGGGSGSTCSVTSLQLTSVGKGEETIESLQGEQSGEFVAPCRGAYVLEFDNTFSMFRSKTIELSISVAGEVEEKEEEETEGMTF